MSGINNGGVSLNIAVIPARGGSKRIPRKNIKEFCGKPMIAWTIETAKKSGLFDQIIVSTDDEEIAQISRKFGAQTPFPRPKNLADDLTPTVPVIAHAVQTCINIGLNPQYVCCIYPCSPFTRSKDLILALEIMRTKNAEFIYPVTEYAHPIQRAMRRLANGKMELFSPEHELTRTQDLEKTFHDTGQFYWGTASAWIEHKKMHTDGLAIPVPNWRTVDIDSLDDWNRAELMFNSLGAQLCNER